MNPNPKLTNGGIWFPTSPDAVSKTNSGAVANFTSLVQLTPGGAYGLAATGWAVTPSPSGAPLKISIAVLAPDGAGGVKVDTGTYVSDPVTEGGGSVIVADFNGDGRQDIVMVAHNEGPIVAKTGYAFMSNAQGRFTKVALPGVTTAHDAQLFYIKDKPAIVTGTFGGDANPIYTYDNGAWVEHLSPSLATPGFGMDSAIAPFGPGGAYRIARGDVYFDYTAPGVAAHIDIAIYGFDTTTFGLTAGSQVETPIQRITPYLSTLPQYKDVTSIFGKGFTHVHRLLAEDLNHDGRPDLLAEQSMWSETGATYPSALQVLLNKADGTFVDKTATLNPDMKLDTDELDYSPSFVDIDRSGINTILLDSGTYQGTSRQSNYLLLNDGTGRLYVALHDQFVALNASVTDFVRANYTPAQNYYVGDTASQFARFIGLPQADGSINYVAQLSVTHQDSPDVWRTGYVYVNVPLAYNPATDFTKSVSITDRNGSSLMRTWAGDDTFSDVGGAPSARIDGGLGRDTVVYSGNTGSYQLRVNTDGSIAVDALASAPVAIHDTLLNIETLKFANGSIETSALKAVSGWFGAILRESITGAHASLGVDTALAMSSGAKTSQQALTDMIRQAGASTSVATLSYEFFTGKIPSQAGVDYLVSPTGPNPNNLNSAYYQTFNLENRYINFAVNLGKIGEGNAKFTADYGSLSLFDATRKAYATIFGGVPSDAKVHALIDSRVDYFAYYGGDGANGIGTKAAMVGWLLAEAQKADLGVMVRSNDAWLNDLSDGSAPFAIDILDPAKGYYKADFIFGGS